MASTCSFYRKVENRTEIKAQLLCSIRIVFNSCLVSVNPSHLFLQVTHTPYVYHTHFTVPLPAERPSAEIQNSMDSDQHTNPLPQPSADYFYWDYRLQLISLGFGFYAAMFLLSHILSVALCRTYNSLPAKEKVFWNLAATRAVFGIQSTVAGLRALTEDSQLSKDKGRGQEDWSWFNVLTAAGFFIFENVAIHTSSLVFWSFDLPLATHHFFALSGYASAVFWDSMGHFLPMVTLLLEMSTPFTCVSWMLLKVKETTCQFSLCFISLIMLQNNVRSCALISAE